MPFEVGKITQIRENFDINVFFLKFLIKKLKGCSQNFRFKNASEVC